MQNNGDLLKSLSLKLMSIHLLYSIFCSMSLELFLQTYEVRRYECCNRRITNAG